MSQLLGSRVMNEESPAPNIDINAIGEAVDEDFVQSVAETASRNAIRPEVLENVPGFDNFLENFSIADKFAGFIGFVASCAATVALGYQVKADFDSGQNAGVKALDILQIVDVGLGAVAGLVGLMAGVEFANLPIVGAAIALAGLVLMIVGLFVKPNPPETQGQKFLDDDGAGGKFIQNLTGPPDPILSYNITPSAIPQNSEATVTLTATNLTSNDVVVKNIQLQWVSGTTAETSNPLLASMDAKSVVIASPVGPTAPDQLFTCSRPVVDPVENTTQLLILATDQTLNTATLKPGGNIVLSFNGKTADNAGGTAQIQILENTDYTTVATDPNTGGPVTTHFTSDAKTSVQVQIT
jgi:hypothetical protein